MSQEGVELVLRQADAVNHRDADAFVATAHPDLEWEDSAFWSEETRIWRGRDELHEWFNKILVEPWHTLHCEVDEITEAPDDRIFFAVLVRAIGKDSGAEIQQRFWSVYWTADAGVVRRQIFLEREDALRAAGLSQGDGRADR